ncbi:Ohr family peroxiredoxin [Salinicoccus albus]|uniref:Ohr family peroxiredoxin n=1 Tax=Salinicoccus albus TaxID=418756 RepID=UPI0003611887|nr:Ohr family peroxiredoxin [Salinicoccus albus]
MSIYEAKVFNTGGRGGEVHSEDNSFKMSVKQPKEMSGEDTNESNPEQLFAAAYSACYNSALDGVLKKDGADDVKRTVIATAKLLKDESDGGFRLGAEIEVEFEGVDQAKADEYVEQAHQGCPYSKMTRDGINVDLKATVK